MKGSVPGSANDARSGTKTASLGHGGLTCTGILYKTLIYTACLCSVIAATKYGTSIEGKVVRQAVDGAISSLSLSATKQPPKVEWDTIEVDDLNLKFSSFKVFHAENVQSTCTNVDSYCALCDAV
jgi:hypothetical protein